jgi:hypothetical protein
VVLVPVSRGGGFRLRAFALALVIGQGLGRTAYAQDEDDEEEEASADNEDGGDSEEEEEEEDEDAKDQPPVTAGGLFTMESYPVRELHRPLTMTQKITQLRLGLGTDVSAKGAFESAGVSLEAIHGARDNVSILGGFTSAYNFKQFGVYAGVEAALAYDLIDVRSALRLSRPAIAAFDPDTMMVVPGEYEAGDIKVSLDVGFPFRYVATPEIAVVALNTLMSIDLDGTKPDLNPSLGIATNPIAPLSVVIFAQLQIIDFDTTADKFNIPATARIQFSPNQKWDIGGEFTFLDLKPEQGNFYDNRFLTLYLQNRFGT